MPRTNELSKLGLESRFPDSLLPNCTSGREEKREAEDSEENESGNSPKLIGANGPGPSHCRETRNQGECGRHATQQWKATLAKRLIGTREDKREHREDARAQNRENAAEIRKKKQKHQANVSFGPVTASPLSRRDRRMQPVHYETLTAL